MNFLGLVNFSASYLPWVLTIFSYAISGSIPYSDVLGITFGHVVWFIEDVAPFCFGNYPIIKKIYFGRLYDPIMKVYAPQ